MPNQSEIEIRKRHIRNVKRIIDDDSLSVEKKFYALNDCERDYKLEWQKLSSLSKIMAEDGINFKSNNAKFCSIFFKILNGSATIEEIEFAKKYATIWLSSD